MADPTPLDPPIVCVVTEMRCGCRGGRACGETCTDCGGSMVRKDIRPVEAADLAALFRERPGLLEEVVQAMPRCTHDEPCPGREEQHNPPTEPRAVVIGALVMASDPRDRFALRENGRFVAEVQFCPWCGRVLG